MFLNHSYTLYMFVKFLYLYLLLPFVVVSSPLFISVNISVNIVQLVSVSTVSVF